jgi:hypothetical protein
MLILIKSSADPQVTSEDQSLLLAPVIKNRILTKENLLGGQK